VVLSTDENGKIHILKCQGKRHFYSNNTQEELKLLKKILSIIKKDKKVLENSQVKPLFGKDSYLKV
jgi:hypothetical protein